MGLEDILAALGGAASAGGQGAKDLYEFQEAQRQFNEAQAEANRRLQLELASQKLRTRMELTDRAKGRKHELIADMDQRDFQRSQAQRDRIADTLRQQNVIANDELLEALVNDPKRSQAFFGELSQYQDTANRTGQAFTGQGFTVMPSRTTRSYNVSDVTGAGASGGNRLSIADRTAIDPNQYAQRIQASVEEFKKTRQALYVNNFENPQPDELARLEKDALDYAVQVNEPMRQALNEQRRLAGQAELPSPILGGGTTPPPIGGTQDLQNFIGGQGGQPAPAAPAAAPAVAPQVPTGSVLKPKRGR